MAPRSGAICCASSPCRRARSRKLWRQKFDPARPNVYRGWFPLQDGHATYKEGIDMGPDVAHGPAAIEAGDILREETPLPPEAALPGWREAVARLLPGDGAGLARC